LIFTCQIPLDSTGWRIAGLAQDLLDPRDVPVNVRDLPLRAALFHQHRSQLPVALDFLLE